VGSPLPELNKTLNSFKLEEPVIVEKPPVAEKVAKVVVEVPEEMPQAVEIVPEV
jgi:hypothetical protein